MEKILRDGQDIYVQVIKEPFNTKGPRLSMFITFPGRYLVLAPNFNHIGISKKITDESERNRLREVVNQIKPNDVSVIVRTAAVNVPSEVIENDLKYLLALWGQAKGIGQKSSAPYLIHQDIDIIQRITRDHYSEDVHKIIIDSKSAFGRLANFLSVSIPAAESKLELYEGDTPIFDIYGIELDIAKALNRKVELPSGGYIIVDQTEALTTFDINTGSYVGRQNARDTVLKTNKEALKRIAEQIRLRNIGGLIVIDFIDMDDAADREQIFLELQAELKNDRAKTSILKISELGLLQMTRKRTSESLEHVLLESCPHCQGRGKIRSTVTEAHDLLREVVRLHTQTKKTLLTVRVRDDIRDWILEEETDWLQDIIDQYGITVNFRANSMTLANMQETSYEISAE
ncbi:MAG: Rne/Rng family ribonuclease [Proteobacteria bacterium]|nr:Rne/Rng family ribonuclease [Pseudomonadota bacterium]